MRKIKVVMLSALVALASFAAISCANNTEETALDKLNKLKNMYTAYDLNYNTDEDSVTGTSTYRNYQNVIKLMDIGDGSAAYCFSNGERVIVSFDYVTLTEYKDFKITLVSQAPTDSYWKALAPEEKIENVGIGKHTFYKEFVINNPSTSTNPVDYRLAFSSEMRDGEGFGNHESSIQLYLNDLNVIPPSRNASLAGGKVVISSENSNGNAYPYGILILLNGTDDSFWTDKRYNSISVENGLNISVSGNNQRPSGDGNTKSFFYPFVSANKTYKFTYLGESVYIFNKYEVCGDVDISQIKDMTLTKPEGFYPKAKLENVTKENLESVLTTSFAKTYFEPYYTITLWGGTDWSNWLGYTNVYSSKFNECTLDLNLISGKFSDNTAANSSDCDSGAITTINNLHGWWYDVYYRIIPNTDSNYSWMYDYFNCKFEYGFSSPKFDTTGVTLVDERY